MNIHTIADHLNSLADNSDTGMNFDCQPISGEVDVLQITISGREELPIFVSVTDDQILCISYLWGIDEVKPDSLTAMHENMWRHPATKDNVKTLTKRGAIVFSPTKGKLASDDFGEGRMQEPKDIVSDIKKYFKSDLKGKNVLITL